MFKIISTPPPSKYRYNKAFTLAEVLITLVIIGVIAAISLPIVMNNIDKQEFVSKLRKIYSVLSQVTNQIIAEEGNPRCGDGGWACSSADIYNLYTKHLNNVKECGKNSGCNVSWKYLNNSQSPDFENRGKDDKFILSDNTQIVIDKLTYSNCSKSQWGTNNVCAYMWVDLNGVKKPNVVGKDVFLFAIKETDLYPFGCDNKSNECSKNSAGRGCACKVLQEGKINY